MDKLNNGNVKLLKLCFRVNLNVFRARLANFQGGGKKKRKKKKLARDRKTFFFSFFEHTKRNWPILDRMRIKFYRLIPHFQDSCHRSFFLQNEKNPYLPFHAWNNLLSV